MTAAGPVLVVGASLAGATFAGALRSAGFDGEITLLGAEDALPYERPDLSKGYLRGTVAADSLLVHPADYYAENRIDLRLGEPAASVDIDSQVVRLDSGEGLAYGTLVIATGAHNVRPPIPGIGLSGVHQLRTLAEADQLRAAAAGARHAVVVGMGFIGCEITATLVELGVAVTAVDGGPGPLWGPLGPELSGVVRSWHEQHDVTVLAPQSVDSFGPDQSGSKVAFVQLTGGERLPADIVVVGVGVRSSTDWLAGTGLTLPDGSVGVDTDGRSAVPGIYAIGDVSAVRDDPSGEHRRHEHWSSAIEQARRAAHHLAGLPGEPPAPPYFWSDQYDHTLQYTGAHDAGAPLIVRGDLTGPSTVFLLAQDRIGAVLSVDDGRQFRRGQKLLGQVASPADLADQTADLRKLARAG